jgi:two-component system chemotaxis sensor kinase CheA
MSEVDEVLQEFIVESNENLDELDRSFVAIEANPGDRTRVGAIFRAIHTIKGTSGFLGCTRLEALTHAGEEVLSLVRDGKLSLTPDVTTELLTMVDGVRAILRRLETTGSEGTEDFKEQIVRLKGIAAGEMPVHVSAPAAAEPASAASSAATPSPAPVVAKEHAPEHAADPPQGAEHHEATSVVDGTVRVDVGLLDKLMNLVGELVLARNQIIQVGAATGDTTLIGASQRLNLITTELQEGVMKTRMRPIGSVWNKYPRIVRDLSVLCGKSVRLEMTGTETEVDRSLLDAIKDPLVHMLRNSVDHGIETQEARTQKGKAATGVLALRAYHEGGKVNIELTDDGQGIDPERVRAKAIERGVVTPERAGRMSERELVNLVFAAGFSTAEKVSNISGRGVGMDVVKTNIERIGGTVELTSRPGQGTTLKVKIPLTLAIIPALVVHLGAERYAIPQVNLLELVRLEAEQAKTAIADVHGTAVLRLRGDLLPLVHLRTVLGEPPPETESEVVNVVILQADDRPFGLIVDGVSDTEEIVVKPLSRELKRVSTFAGATIMGDGRVALILDVVGVAQRANVLSESRERAISLASKGTGLEQQGGAKDALLLLERGGKERLALPLDQVSRLEEFARATVERAGDTEVVQYRGEILRLISLDEVLGPCMGGAREDHEAPLQVVVFTQGGKSVGLVVGRILDIVQDSIVVKPTGRRHGVSGTAVIDGKVTQMLDVRTALSGTMDDAA